MRGCLATFIGTILCLAYNATYLVAVKPLQNCTTICAVPPPPPEEEEPQLDPPPPQIAEPGKISPTLLKVALKIGFGFSPLPSSIGQFMIDEIMADLEMEYPVSAVYEVSNKPFEWEETEPADLPPLPIAPPPPVEEKKPQPPTGNELVAAFENAQWRFYQKWCTSDDWDDPPSAAAAVDWAHNVLPLVD
jgi:hypothetical protein